MLKICPRCGSKNVKWIIPQNCSQWVCYDCDYTGPIIEGDQELADEIHESYLESKNHEKTDLGIISFRDKNRAELYLLNLTKNLIGTYDYLLCQSCFNN